MRLSCALFRREKYVLRRSKWGLKSSDSVYTFEQWKIEFKRTESEVSNAMSSSVSQNLIFSSEKVFMPEMNIQNLTNHVFSLRFFFGNIPLLPKSGIKFGGSQKHRKAIF